MTHYFSAGLKTASSITEAWVTKKGFKTETYEKFFTKSTKEVKSIKQALLTFCSKGTKLNLFFKKVALVVLCDAKRYKLLDKKSQLVINSFQDELLTAGISKNIASAFYGLGFSSLIFVSPFGTKVEYSTIEISEEKTKAITS